jgi:hypothetical protein
MRNLPADPEFGVPVPFACTRDFHAGGGGTVRRVEVKRVWQCALSRICGICGETLGRPIAFLGTEQEVGRNGFHFPPMHVECAQTAQTLYADLPTDALGIGERETFDAPGSEPHEPWVLVTTSGFEFVRPTTEQADRRPTFEPNSLLS